MYNNKNKFYEGMKNWNGANEKEEIAKTINM